MASGTAAEAHVHIVDDVEELLNDGDTSKGLQDRLLGDGHVGHVEMTCGVGVGLSS